jgi:hypothetical protein
MRRLFFLALVGILTNSAARSQPSQLDVDLVQKLGEHGVFVGTDFDGKQSKEQVILVLLQTVNAAKVLELVPRLTEISRIRVEVHDGNVTDSQEKILRAFSSAKSLTIHDSLSEKGIQVISQFDRIERLELKIGRFDFASLKPLQRMKSLKHLHLSCSEFSPKELAEFKKSMAHVKEIVLYQNPAILGTPLLKESPKDDAILKLKKKSTMRRFSRFDPTPK